MQCSLTFWSAKFSESCVFIYCFGGWASPLHTVCHCDAQQWNSIVTVALTCILFQSWSAWPRWPKRWDCFFQEGLEGGARLFGCSFSRGTGGCGGGACFCVCVFSRGAGGGCTFAWLFFSRGAGGGCAFVCFVFVKGGWWGGGGARLFEFYLPHTSLVLSDQQNYYWVKLLYPVSCITWYHAWWITETWTDPGCTLLTEG